MRTMSLLLEEEEVEGEGAPRDGSLLLLRIFLSELQCCITVREGPLWEALLTGVAEEED